MKQFDFTKYIKNNILLKENINEARTPDLIIPANDAYDMEEEAQNFADILDQAGIMARCKPGFGEVEVYLTDKADVRKAVAVLKKAGYQSQMKENVSISGDWNDADINPRAKRAAGQYTRTPEGQLAVQAIQKLVAKPFDAFKLQSTLKRCKFPSMNAFKAAAVKGGLDIEGQGNVDNEGNGDFAVWNDNYTDQGAAIAFIDDKFYSVG